MQKYSMIVMIKRTKDESSSYYCYVLFIYKHKNKLLLCILFFVILYKEHL